MPPQPGLLLFSEHFFTEPDQQQRQPENSHKYAKTGQPRQSDDPPDRFVEYTARRASPSGSYVTCHIFLHISFIFLHREIFQTVLPTGRPLPDACPVFVFLFLITRLCDPLSSASTKTDTRSNRRIRIRSVQYVTSKNPGGKNRVFNLRPFTNQNELVLSSGR